MRALAFLVCSLAVVSASAQKSVPLTGSWKSPDVGFGDYPIWMVDIYYADGTCQTDFYSQPEKRVIHHTDKTMHRVYRLEGDSLSIGTVDSEKRFHIEGLPRKVRRDSSGRVVAIEEWTRIK